jgi:ABC-type branched-subunit amino acid transport system permease subunit
MNISGRKPILYGIIIIASLIAPWLMPAYQTQLAFLWVMVVFALTWDIVGGQMGYNSFGNIVTIHSATSSFSVWVCMPPRLYNAICTLTSRNTSMWPAAWKR